MYLAFPIGTTSFRALALVLLWPRNGVALREVLELAVAAAIIDAIVLRVGIMDVVSVGTVMLMCA